MTTLEIILIGIPLWITALFTTFNLIHVMAIKHMIRSAELTLLTQLVSSQNEIRNKLRSQ